MANERKGRLPRRARRRPAKRAGEGVVSFRYIETSALLCALLEQDVVAQRAVMDHGCRITSALTFAVATRVLIRARLRDRISADIERAARRWLSGLRRNCNVMNITASVLVRAGRPCPVEPSRTLDAIHLATAEEIGEPLLLISVATRDEGVRDNAQARGHSVG